MNKLYKNVLLFTVGLFLLTLSVETLRHGRLQIGEPLPFVIAILVLGIIGGYVITWVSEAKDR
jgi:hypothetical protein